MSMKTMIPKLKSPDFSDICEGTTSRIEAKTPCRCTYAYEPKCASTCTDDAYVRYLLPLICHIRLICCRHHLRYISLLSTTSDMSTQSTVVPSYEYAM